MTLPTILLIEDDEIDVENVVRAFQQRHMANLIIHVTDRLCAFEVLRGTPDQLPLAQPYLILLDMNMLRMNGLQFLHELRQDPALMRSVVFVLSTSAAEQDIDAAYDEQIAGYIMKANVGENWIHPLELLEKFQKVVRFPN